MPDFEKESNRKRHAFDKLSEASPLSGAKIELTIRKGYYRSLGLTGDEAFIYVEHSGDFLYVYVNGDESKKLAIPLEALQGFECNGKKFSI